MQTNTHDLDDVMAARPKSRERWFLSAGRGRRIFVWQIGPSWFAARYQAQVHGVWTDYGRASYGASFPEAAERLQGKR